MQSVLTLIYDEAKRIWQYRWLSLVVACGVFIAAALYIEQLPNVYYSWAQIFVSGHTTLSQLAEGVAVKSNQDSQVYLVQKTLLNDQTLGAVVRRVNMGMDVSTPAGRENAKAFIRNHVTITNGDNDGFINIYFRDTNPVRARDVAKALLDLFIASNLDQNRQGLKSAQTFLDKELADTEQKLRAADQAVTAYHLAHYSILGTGNGEGGLSARLAAAQASVDAAQTGGVTPRGESPDIAAARARLASLRSQFTDQYPDVVAARRDLERVIASHAAGATQYSSGHTSGASSSLGAAQGRLARLRAMQSRAPEIVAQYAELSRKADIIRSNYQALLTRRESVRFSQALDRSDDSAHYRVTVQPGVANTPEGPNRPLYLLFAFGGAIGAGLIAAYLLAAMRGIFVAPRELEQAFDLPVVGTVSWEEAWHNKPHRSRFANVYFGLLALLVVVSAAVYANGFTFDKLATVNFDWLSNLFR
jgi:polysaccharide chain length determinant protein (PEP-CTERM system associated)